MRDQYRSIVIFLLLDHLFYNFRHVVRSDSELRNFSIYRKLNKVRSLLQNIKRTFKAS